MEVKPGYKQTEVGVIPEDWVVKSLRDLGKFKNGINKGKEDFGHGFPFVNLLDVFGIAKVSHDVDFGLVNSSAAERNLYDLKRGDVLFVRSSVKPEGVGLTTLVSEDLPNTVFSGFLIRFRDDDQLAFEYKEHCFGGSGFRSKLIANSTVSANTNINQDALNALQLAFPPEKQEQRSISATLSDVDALIKALDRLIAKKQEIKQAAMQELLTGTRRLPGFGGEWKAQKLGEAGRCLRGVSYRGDLDLSPYDTKSTIRLLRANNIQDSNILKSNLQFVDSSRVSDQQVMQRQDILICMANGSKDLVGKAGIFQIYDGHDYTFGAFMGCFRTIFSISHPAFVSFLFQTGKYRSYINNLIAGSSINNLKPSDIESLEFYFPLLDEQKAIADVLLDIDAEICALERQRDKTKFLKQGMMQELLTGRIRLVEGGAT